MPLNGFSVGRDISTNIQTPTGLLPLPGLTKFSAKPETTVKKVKLINGRTKTLIFPDGWAGSFEVERMNGDIDTFFAAQEANYYAGQNLLPSSITETITEADGSTSQYQYTGVILKLDDSGDWAGDETVKQKLSFTAETRIKVA
ncbi:hypothetical protein [Cupriavidus basilensis]|uniref:hypothetical protein n=1 Tax=Cupriavidus basilensis TaxID=68895 RepID=UPI0039F69D0D